MKKVFEAELSIDFVERLNNHLCKEYEFHSANGISGEVLITPIMQENETTHRVIVAVLTERKRKFETFEYYLNLISTVVSNKNKVSVVGLKDVRTKMVRTTLDNVSEIEELQDYKIVQDEDMDYLIVRKKDNFIVNYFDALNYAQEELKRINRV